MNRFFRRAFSLIEILITLAIVGFIVAIVVVSYSNIRENAESIVQDDSQRSFLRALETFTSTGGDLGQITGATELSDTDKAYALIAALQKTADPEKREATGRVSSLVRDDLIVVAADESAASPRLRFVGDSVVLANDNNPGFLISSDSGKSPVAVANTAGVAAAASDSLNALSEGALYATSSSYLWDEDNTIITGPASVGANTGAVSGGLTGSEIIIAFGDSIAGVPNANPMAYDYSTYTSGDAHIQVFAYRRDAVDLTTAEINLVVKFDGAVVGSAVNAVRNVHSNKVVTSGGTSVNGVLIDLPTTALKAPNQWSSGAYNLSAQANSTGLGSLRGLGTAAAIRTLSAIPSPLNPPTIALTGDFNNSGPHAGVIDSGEVITINSEVNNPGVPVAAYIADPSPSGGELSFYDVSLGSISTLTLK